jgi:membrane associated rhomboid family serine protease
MVILPIGDKNPRRGTAWVNWLLIAANVAVFFLCVLRPPHEAVEIVDRWALKPDRWTDLKTILSSMFLHGRLLHLGGNMLFLYIAGDNVEDRLGHLAYLLFYLAAGVAAAAAHVVYAFEVKPDMLGTPVVGASGAISGVMGAYLAFFPGSKIKFVLWLFVFIRPFTLPAWGALGMWVVSQLLLAKAHQEGLVTGEAAMVAVFAHLGGFAFGLAVAAALRLFGKPPPSSKKE